MLFFRGKPHFLASRGFSLIELLVVIAILCLLAGLILPALAESRRHANKVQCQSQLFQLYKGLLIFDGTKKSANYTENFPDRLTYLHQDGSNERFVADARIYVCPLDASLGKEGGKPLKATSQFRETDEGPRLNNGGGFDPPCDLKAPYCSYMYELSGAQITWGIWLADPVARARADLDNDGKISWKEGKLDQQRYEISTLHLNGQIGYARTRFPVIRCFHHMRNPDDSKEEQVQNVSMDGNVFESSPLWEKEAVKALPLP